MNGRARPVRVGIDLTPASVGLTGIARYSRMLWQYLRERDDVDVSAFAAGRSAPLADVRHLPIPLRFLHRSWRWLGVPSAESLLGDVDVVHCLDLLPPPTRRPLVMTWHDTFRLSTSEYHAPSALANRKMRIAALNRTSFVVTTCQSTAEEIVDMTRFPRDRIVIAYPGFSGADDPAPRPVAADFVLAAGALTPRKGFDVLARAMSMLGKDAPPLVIAGPDGYRADVVKKAIFETLDPNRCKLIGDWYGSMASLYKEAMIVCHPSLAEGFGLVCLEAMGAGAAVVAADIPSIREIAAGSVALVPPGDPAAMADAIRRLLTDESERNRLGSLAKQRARDFSWESMAAESVRAYELAAS